MTPKKVIRKNVKVGAAVFSLALGGGLLAGSVLGSPGATSAASVAAATADDSSTDAAADASAPLPETPLEGDTATKVTEAAQAAVPDGTIDRVETDNDGVYEAHVTKADGTKVIVQVGEDFTVTAIVDQPQGGPGGPGGHGGPAAPPADAASTTNATADATTAG
jgi:hypothetical protein